ncbi:hypothetical protein NC651_008242 [Populus alba x Populus x berolinensis]|nr:hypothetical protein NC651_008242 [Populus alba x Populus x berolinensis]
MHYSFLSNLRVLEHFQLTKSWLASQKSVIYCLDASIGKHQLFCSLLFVGLSRCIKLFCRTYRFIVLDAYYF